MNYEKPNKDNVTLEDFLIDNLHDNSIKFKIININKNTITGKRGDRIWVCPYEKAVVQKKDGTYLVGENAENF